ncbi:MAG: ATP-binding protein [Phycisphaerae bacterium]
MNLTTRTVLFISLVVGFVLLALGWYVKVYAVGEIDNLRRHQTQTEITLIKTSLENVRDEVERAVQDYSLWDDTYRFAQDHNPAYVETNFNPVSMKGRELDLVIVTDNNKDIVLGRRLEGDKIVAVLAATVQKPSPWHDAAKRMINLMTKNGTTEVRPGEIFGGLMVVNEEPNILAVSPIYKTKGEGQPVGYFIFGRKIEADWLSGLQNRYGMQFKLMSPAFSSLSPTVRDTLIFSKETDPMLPVTRGEQTQVWSRLTTLEEGNPMLIRLDQTALGLAEDIKMLVIWGFGAILIVAGTTLVLTRTVRKPLRQLRVDIEACRAEGKMSARVRLPDEQSLRDVAGAVNTMLADIQMAQAKAVEIDSHYRLIMDGAGVGGWTSDERGCITFANDVVAEMLGYQPWDLVGKSLRDMVAVDYRDLLDSVMQAAGLEGTSLRPVEVMLQRRDGGNLWVELTAVGLIKDRRQVGHFGVMTNTSARHEAEMAIRQRDELLETTADVQLVLLHSRAESFEQSLQEAFGLVGDAIGADRVYIFENEVDATGNPLMSQRYEWFCDEVKDRMSGRSLQGLPYLPDYERWFTELSRGRGLSGHVRDFPASERMLLESQNTLSVAMAPIDVEGKFWGYIGFDALLIPHQWSETEMHVLAALGNAFGAAIMARRLEVELREAKETAETTARVKAQFLANMSHEIRTPMTAIVGFADLLGMGAVPEPVQREALESIQRNSQYLQRLLTDILDMTKLDVGQMTIACEQVDPVHVVEEVANMLGQRARDKRMRIRMEIEPETPRVLWTDSVRLRQVVVNLVSNAIKFSDHGDVIVKVERADMQLEPRLQIAVIDNGIGIPAEQFESVFQAFVQADNTSTRRFGGTGLGLTISRQLARLMGGDITVKSRVGHGSTFTLSLPVRDSASATTTLSPAALTTGAANGTDREDVDAIMEMIGSEVEPIDDLVGMYSGSQAPLTEPGPEAETITPEPTPEPVPELELEPEPSLPMVAIPEPVSEPIPEPEPEPEPKAEPVPTPPVIAPIAAVEKPVPDPEAKAALDAYMAEFESLAGFKSAASITSQTPPVVPNPAPVVSTVTMAKSKTKAKDTTPTSVAPTDTVAPTPEPERRTAVAVYKTDTPVRTIGEAVADDVMDKPVAPVRVAAKVNSQPEVPPLEANPPPSPDKPLAGMRVLLAEDGQDNCMLMQYMVERAGAKITIVGNGLLARNEALVQKEAGSPYHVVLMDMQMPEMDGYEATRQLRAKGYRGLIVALTAHALAGDRETCLHAGCDEYCSKPVNWGKLFGIMRKLCGLKG